MFINVITDPTVNQVDMFIYVISRIITTLFIESKNNQTDKSIKVTWILSDGRDINQSQDTLRISV